jgi:outer membrane receptor protein involved in Fe transport
MVDSTYRRVLGATAVALLFPLVSPRAQTTTGAAATGGRSATEEAAVELPTVEVTGSRLRSLVGEQPAMPVVSFDTEELARRGVSRLADIRWAIPQLGASIGFNDNLMNGGPSRAQQASTSFDLRGLGGNSTLVLVDGRRIPRTGQAYPAGAGGREDFNIDGLPLAAIDRIEILPQGAGAIYGSEAIAGVVNIVLKKRFNGGQLDLTYDNTFDSDVANLTASITAGVTRGKFSGFATLTAGSQNALAARDRDFSFAPAVSVFNPYEGATLSTAFYPAQGGAALPGLSTHVVSLPAGTSGTGYTVADLVDNPIGPLYNFANYSMLVDESRTRSVLLKGGYAMSESVRFYVEGRWSRLEFGYTGTPLTLFRQLPANYLGNPFDVPVYLGKAFYDIRPEVEARQTNSGLTFGVQGDIGSGWRYDLGLSWTRNVVFDDSVRSGFNFAALTAALAQTDPANQINLTYDSRTSGAYTGALDGVLASSLHEDTSDVYDLLFTADGPVLTGWAGDVRLAVGGQSQREEVRFFRTPTLGFELTAPFERTVNAAFAEVAVPLLGAPQKLPGVHRLEVRAAGRYEDFSDIGSQTTPSVSALYQPTEWITVRASRSEGFKSPKLYDLLSPTFQSTTTITAARNISDTARGGEAVVGTFGLTSGGQPGLSPETSVSRNIGIVVDVPWVTGLSFSADWWDTLFADRVGTTSFQTLIDFFPERVTRGPRLDSDPAGWLGPITSFDTSALNLAWVKARGYDLGISYHRITGMGEFMLTGKYTHQNPQETRATPASAIGLNYRPERFSGSFFWAKDGWEAGVSVNYQGLYPIFGIALPDLAYPSYIEWNPKVSYSFADDMGSAGATRFLSGVKVGLTVVNAFNAGPSDIAAANNRVVMDPRLRRYIVNFSKKF